jgi:hypothetical protein
VVLLSVVLLSVIFLSVVLLSVVLLQCGTVECGTVECRVLECGTVKFGTVTMTERRENLSNRVGDLVPLPFCPPQIPHGLKWDRSPASLVTGRQLTA